MGFVPEIKYLVSCILYTHISNLLTYLSTHPLANRSPASPPTYPPMHFPTYSCTQLPTYLYTRLTHSIKRINKTTHPPKRLRSLWTHFRTCKPHTHVPTYSVFTHLPCYLPTYLRSNYLLTDQPTNLTSLGSMVSHRGHNCIFSALTILDSALTS